MIDNGIPNVVWIGPRAADAAVLSGNCRTVATFSADSGAGGTNWSLEARIGVRRRWGAASVAEVVAMFGAEIREAVVRADAAFPYAMDAALPVLIGPHARLLGPSPELWNRLDDKRAAVRIFDAARVPRLSYREMPASHLPRLAAPGHNEHRLVVQIPRASGGKGTYFVRAEAGDLACLAARLSGSEVLVTDFEHGSYSLNAHLAILPGGVLIGPLSVQLVGIQHCIFHPAGYCGNDFAAMYDLDVGVTGRAMDIITSVGQSLVAEGFRGMAGLDLLVTTRRGGIFPIDLNPRFQASTRALAEAEHADGAGPGFVDLAVGSQLGIYGSDDLRRYVPQALPMTQLVFYQRSPIPRCRPAGEHGTTATVGGWELTGLAPAGVRVEHGAVLATATRLGPERVSPEAAAEELVRSVEVLYEFAQ